jgi:hypothetical protein
LFIIADISPGLRAQHPRAGAIIQQHPRGGTACARTQFISMDGMEYAPRPYRITTM